MKQKNRKPEEKLEEKKDANPRAEETEDKSVSGEKHKTSKRAEQKNSQELNSEAVTSTFMLAIGFVAGSAIAAIAVLCLLWLSSVVKFQKAILEVHTAALSAPLSPRGGGLPNHTSTPTPPTASNQLPQTSQQEEPYMKHFPGSEEYSAPRVIPVLNLFTKEECEWIIHTVEKYLHLNDGVFSVLDMGEQPVTEKFNPAKKSTRISKSAGLAKDATFGWVYDRILGQLLQLNKQHWRYQLPVHRNSSLVEYMQYALYNSSQLGHYDWHQDNGVSGATAKRKISVTVQLSDPTTYEGGDLAIIGNLDQVLHMERAQGSAAFFQSYMIHKVGEVTSGLRRSLALWVQTMHT